MQAKCKTAEGTGLLVEHARSSFFFVYKECGTAACKNATRRWQALVLRAIRRSSILATRSAENCPPLFVGSVFRTWRKEPDSVTRLRWVSSNAVRRSIPRAAMFLSLGHTMSFLFLSDISCFCLVTPFRFLGNCVLGCQQR